jgi:hydrogenase-4 membrane subunit HyfE
MIELLIRFLAGGVVVSFFAMLGDVLRPKSFAGLFSAAPSVALATLTLTIHSNGKAFTAHEAQTMLLGAAAFLLYAVLVSFVLRQYRPSALRAAIALLPVWFAVALGSWLTFTGRW